MRMIALSALLLGTACNIPPKDPFVAAERALRGNDLLRALQAYDAVPVAHVRYPDARAAAGDVEQRMRRCHELILEALRLRSEWRDAEALEALQRAGQHWPQQPSLRQWISATEKRLQLFADRGSSAASPVAEMPASPIVEVARIGRPQLSVATESGASEVAVSNDSPPPVRAEPEYSSPSQPSGASSVAGLEPVEVPAANVPQPMLPEAPRNPSKIAPPVAIPEPATSGLPAPSSANSESAADPVLVEPVASNPRGAGSSNAGGKPVVATPEPSTTTKPSPVKQPQRLPTGEDPVVLGLVAVEARLGRGELVLAVRDLIELSRRFTDDVRVNRRLSRLLHQRALMSYGQGSVAAAVTDWRRVLAIEPSNHAVKKLLKRAMAESRAAN
ncbi:MAG: hypothetical protein ACI85K_002155 [Hyphomicrobiaceae bacterium]|jgi:hypothetical protein